TASTATATTTSAVLLPLGGAGGTAPPGPGGGAGGLPSGWEPFGTGPGGAGGCRDTDPSCLNSSVRCPSRDAVRPPWSVTGGGRARARPGPRARSAERVLAVAAVVRVQAAAAGHGVLLEGAADVGRPVEVVARDHVAVVAVLGVRLERRVVVDLGVVERRRRRRPGLDVVARHPDVGQVGHVWQVGHVGQVDVGFDRRAAGEVDQPLAVAPDELEVVGPRLAAAGAVLDRHRRGVLGLVLDRGRQDLGHDVVAALLDHLDELGAVLVEGLQLVLGDEEGLAQGVAVPLDAGLDEADRDGL